MTGIALVEGRRSHCHFGYQNVVRPVVRSYNYRMWTLASALVLKKVGAASYGYKFDKEQLAGAVCKKC